MKKVGICACYNTLNYGSMLQSLATQVTIDAMGYESEFIVYKKKKTPVFLLKQIPRLLNKALAYEKMLGLKKQVQLRKYPFIKDSNARRNQAFSAFQKKYYKRFSDVYYGYDQLCAGAENYDTVVVGSDQLWSPAGLATNFYNLMFVPDSINKVSYATSFGVSSIPGYQKRRTKRYLERFDALSVREEKGAQIVKEISGRDSKIVLDPTLLLTRTQWADIIPHKRLVEEPYLFCYFLGENEQHRNAAREMSKQLGLKIVSTPFLDTFVKADLNFGDYPLYDVGPDDFVNLIRNAEYILTDSFHGSVFSVLHHKKFVVLNRYVEGKNSRNSRIDSLLGQLALEDRRGDNDLLSRIQEEIDYKAVDEKLDSLRTDSLEYLAGAVQQNFTD